VRPSRVVRVSSPGVEYIGRFRLTVALADGNGQSKPAANGKTRVSPIGCCDFLAEGPGLLHRNGGGQKGFILGTPREHL
jgi:hypothetical protein